MSSDSVVCISLFVLLRVLVSITICVVAEFILFVILLAGWCRWDGLQLSNLNWVGNRLRGSSISSNCWSMDNRLRGSSISSNCWSMGIWNSWIRNQRR